ncbi:MAG: carbohydrate ABC transporter permease [Spirochaetes bacterium]|nr:carbohydrate ABC transporter permease [Spirochaetota bacterium]
MVTTGTKSARIRFGAFFYIASSMLVGFWLLPIIFAFFTSVKSLDEIMRNPYMWAIPKVWEFGNFYEVFVKVGMGRYVFNTVLITVPSVFFALLISSLSAFALTFYKFRTNKFLFLMFVAGMMLPFQMLMIPVYRFSDATGLINTRLGVILFHVAFQLGFCTFFLRNFLKNVPFSLFESARIDGANDLLIYYKIVLPLTVPAMAALAVLEFTWIWNDLLWSLVIIQSDHLKPVTLGLANMQGEFISNYNMIAAGSFIAACGPLALFLMFQRYFIEGLTVGAEKG